MADPAGETAATAAAPTDAPTDTGNGDLTPDQRKAVESAEKPDEVREIISAASRRARQAEAELKTARQELQGLQDAGKSELDKATLRAERAEARVTELESTMLRASIAAEFGIPQDEAHRLHGTSEEELRADAKVFAKRFPRQEEPETTPGDLGAGPRGGAAGTGSRAFSDQIRRRAQGRR